MLMSFMNSMFVMWHFSIDVWHKLPWSEIFDKSGVLLGAVFNAISKIIVVVSWFIAK